MTFGDFDATDARWSPDGRRIAFISNKGGNTSLWVMTVSGGAMQRVVPAHRHYKTPRATLRIEVRDEHGKAMAARVAVVAADGRAYAPGAAWLHADDGFDRKLQPFETHYFHCPGVCTMSVPVGAATVTVSRGLDYAIDVQSAEIGAHGATMAVALKPLRLPARFGKWVSADLHVHMNYGGHYRATSETLAAAGPRRSISTSSTISSSTRNRAFPTLPGSPIRPRTIGGVLIVQGQEYHSSYWGHLGLLDLDDHFLTPGFHRL